MHEDEFVRESEDALRRAASNPAEVQEVEELIEAARVVAEYRLLTEIWWPSPEQAMRKIGAGELSAEQASEAMVEFETWQEAARELTSARKELQERMEVVPLFLWGQSPDDRGGRTWRT